MEGADVIYSSQKMPRNTKDLKLLVFSLCLFFLFPSSTFLLYLRSSNARIANRPQKIRVFSLHLFSGVRHVGSVFWSLRNHF